MATESLSTDVALGRSPGYAAFRCGGAGQAHNEAAFRHLLAIELRRAESSGQALLLVLVSVRRDQRVTGRLTIPTSRGIFEALGASVREVDFVGWFRENRVAAATLVQRGHVTPELRRQIATRVAETLRARVQDADGQLRLRVILLRGRP